MKRVMMVIVALCAVGWTAGDAAAQYGVWSRPRGYVTYRYAPYGAYAGPYRAYGYYPGYQYYYPGYTSYPSYSYYPGSTYYGPSYGYYRGYAYPGYVRPGITLRFGW